MSAKQNEIRSSRTDSRTHLPGSPAEAASCALAIKAIPNAPRSEVIGWLGDSLKVKIHAPPVEGRANEALCEFLADQLDIPRRHVSVLRGDTSRQKVVRIASLTLEQVKAKLGL